MRIDMDAFPKHKYIGEDREQLGYTKGKEYHRVLMGTWFLDNTYGVYMTTDAYDGGDIDYCHFLPVKTFNSLFTPTIPLTETLIWKDRNRNQYLHRKKKLDIARNKFGKEFVEDSIKEGDAGKLYSMSYKCTCSSCERPHSLKDERKMREMDGAMREYDNEEKECS